MQEKLGEMLVQAKRITRDQLERALSPGKEPRTKLSRRLVDMGFVTDHEIADTFSTVTGVPLIDCSQLEIAPDVLKMIPWEVARKYCVVPVMKTAKTLTLAMADPTDLFALDDIQFMTGLSIEPAVAAESGIKDVIEKYFRPPSLSDLAKDFSENDVIEKLEDEATPEARMLRHEFWLRSRCKVIFELPDDLTSNEARRLAGILQLLVTQS